jgi:hypothetical protein
MSVPPSCYSAGQFESDKVANQLDSPCRKHIMAQIRKESSKPAAYHMTQNDCDEHKDKRKKPDHTVGRTDFRKDMKPAA